ncbi:LysR substrate-binding domain-containing protein [Ideonella sp.]|uniref:LysR substrate-binding domain-containing protein n=1 Tax=Ideonella sp. TaxID=1929293 RepID=UPI002B497D60|nr:LysR substrate-binding domain-containing protein [Ideonella sp.]HJV70699.1 LysR substrate-binding domain-containing protein [Ideonella sp.]
MGRVATAPGLVADVPLRALRAVAAVAAHGGVSHAAQALHQSPAAVTRAVQGAERAFGVALFERGARGMLPTAAGEVLVQRVQRALQALQDAAQGLRSRGAPASVASLPRLVSDSLLQALVARAAHPTEAAAAAAAGLSQPALHQALRRLEHAARVPLYERTRLGARLNESGQWLVQQVKVAYAEIRVGREELARWCGRDESRVAIGSLPMATDLLVPQAVARTLAARPQLRITVMDGTYESLTRLLRDADVDLLVGPLRGDARAGDLAEEVLYVDRFVAVVRRGHPLLADGRRASLRRLAPYPWIGPLPGTPADAVFDRLFAQAGLPRPPVALRAHSTTVLRSVLLAGDHVALLSPLQAHEDVQAGLLCYASPPLPGSERAIGITQRRDALASSACGEVIAALRQVAAEAVADLPR